MHRAATSPRGPSDRPHRSRNPACSLPSGGIAAMTRARCAPRVKARPALP
ncbi:Hypothetical protein CAP_7890 [Chondromyces apiculatus DSM 436]|uniref:Uncharacterized protein n=1 Tax=Chondromyces apiculatus DSM 436 TaxID=1192034 RepID=A0A017SYJ2_9BACT|nr:Hypothetical protein CAP_7890 [Chondromyces apiculatus DSM 436]